jgi:folylpolyglutamate synthase/dihydropteroate synthase
MTEILFPLASGVIATRAENPRSATPEEITLAAARTSIEVEMVPDVGSAIERALVMAAGKAPLVITGSIYLVGEAMKYLKLHA